MSKPLLSVILVLMGCSAVNSAGFDCAKAGNPVEKAICTDAELSALDDKMTRLYNDILTKLPGADDLKYRQKAWLKNVRNDCAGSLTRGFGKGCLQRAYLERIEAIQCIAAFGITPGVDPFSQFKIDKVSKQYDFILRMKNLSDPEDKNDEGSCDGYGQLMIYLKGDESALQTVYVKNFYEFSDGINIDDFNFDGQEDFAVPNGNNGPYGSRTYDVYLYSKEKQKFEFNESLTTIAEGSLVFFEVDTKQKRLITMTKSGCCFHQRSEYEVLDNKPIEVFTLTEDATVGDDKTEVTTEKRLTNGKWQITTKRYAAGKYNP